jgi:hypothetical protein
MKKVFTKKFYIYFYLLGIVNLFFLTIAVLIYGEPFIFWMYPLSDLGGTHTINGFENPAKYFYWMDMIVSGVIMLIAAYALSQYRRFRFKPALVPIFITAGIGFFIGMAPDDTMDPVHVLGSVMFFASLWLIIVLFLSMLHKHIPWGLEFLWHVLFQVSVLLYAFAFFMGLDSKQIFQKVACFSLFVTLITVTRLVYTLKAYK